jgi:hypothetical protein
LQPDQRPGVLRAFVPRWASVIEEIATLQAHYPTLHILTEGSVVEEIAKRGMRAVAPDPRRRRSGDGGELRFHRGYKPRRSTMRAGWVKAMREIG